MVNDEDDRRIRAEMARRVRAMRVVSDVERLRAERDAARAEADEAQKRLDLWLTGVAELRRRTPCRCPGRYTGPRYTICPDHALLEVQSRGATIGATVHDQWDRIVQERSEAREGRDAARAEVERLELENGTLSAMVVQNENCPDVCPDVEQLRALVRVVELDRDAKLDAKQAEVERLREAATRVVGSRHDDLDTGSCNWVAVLDCHLTALADALGGEGE